MGAIQDNPAFVPGILGGAFVFALLLGLCCVCGSKLLLKRNTDPAVNNMRFVKGANNAAANTVGGKAAMATLARMADGGVGGASGGEGGASAAAGDWGDTGLSRARKNSSAAAMLAEAQRPEPILNPLVKAATDFDRAATTVVQVGAVAAMKSESAAAGGFKLGGGR